MLEKIDLDKKMSQKEFDEKIKELHYKLAELQRSFKANKIPTILLFEGLDSIGKSQIINQLIQSLDPREFKFFYIEPPTPEELSKPFLWRYWNKTPPRGLMSILDKSWYKEIVIKEVEGEKKSKTNVNYPEIKDFERQLSRDGYVLVKFFIHTSKDHLKRRTKDLEKVEEYPLVFQEEMEEKVSKYDQYIDTFEEMLESTDSAFAPWMFIEGDNVRFAVVKVFMLLINMMETKLKENQNDCEPEEIHLFSNELNDMNASILDKVDLTLDMKKDEYEEKLKENQQRIKILSYQLYNLGVPAVIVLEGWDAAGKGGLIRRVTSVIDPRFYNVIPIAKPNDLESDHHYLWRFWNQFPRKGDLHIFDRSWYGRVLVERVEGFATDDEWKRAYKEINEMEKSLHNFGAVILKFWLHFDKDEQLKRFQSRQETPHKQWKITDDDWRNREKWSHYKIAVDEMLFRTSTTYAPWDIIEFASKRFGRIKAMEKIIEAFEKKVEEVQNK